MNISALKVTAALVVILSLNGWVEADELEGKGASQLQIVSSETLVSASNTIQRGGGFLVDFGLTEIGFIRRVTIGYTNTGQANITNISLSAITGPNLDAFSIFNDGCTGETLIPQEQCPITIDFEPPSVGTFNAQFDVISSAADSPERIFLLGTGAIDTIFSDRFEPPATSTRNPGSVQ